MFWCIMDCKLQPGSRNQLEFLPLFLHSPNRHSDHLNAFPLPCPGRNREDYSPYVPCQNLQKIHWKLSDISEGIFP